MGGEQVLVARLLLGLLASGRVGGVCKIIRAMPGEGADCHPLSFGMFFEGALLIVPCLYLIVP